MTDQDRAAQVWEKIRTAHEEDDFGILHIGFQRGKEMLAAYGQEQFRAGMEAKGLIPYKCPVCDGQGTVNKPSWVAGDQHEYTAAGCGPYPCRACGGTGIIWAANDVEVTKETFEEMESLRTELSACKEPAFKLTPKPTPKPGQVIQEDKKPPVRK